MICPHCAAENPDQARYCNHCAAPLAALLCPNCQGGNRAAARFCVLCGQGLSLACPNCAAHLPHAGAAFCDQCGHDLGAGLNRAQPETFRQAAVQPLAATSPAAPSPPRPQARPAPWQGQRPAQATGSNRLRRYVPQELLRKLEAAQAGGGMIGERRTVTMLFCDVKGSTAAAEQLDPEEWTEIINGAFERMIQPVYAYEGTLARLMGDAILAFFGAPIAHEDDPQRAILAGLDILAGIAPFREEVQARYGVDFNVRVGINTGRVVVGAMGSDLRMEYTAMGDAVNLAARMEQTAQPGTVQVAEDTYRLVKPLFEFEALGPLEVKGRAEPVAAYRVLGRKVAPGRVRGIEGLNAPLIGREGEWARLTAAARSVRKGVGQIVFLVGEAGLGKTRLIRELKQAAANGQLAGDRDGEDRSVAWFETASMSYETAQPYSLFQRLLRQVMGASESDSPADLRQKLAGLLDGTPDPEREEFLAVSESLLGLPSANGRPPLEGEAFKGLLYTVSTRLWRQLAAQQPTILVCDDLHWSDPASAALLQHLFPLSEQAPLMFLCATRAERDAPGWALKEAVEKAFTHRYTEINVRPLSPEDSNRLVDNLLHIADLPAKLRSRIQTKAEGNPFFVEEVVRALIDAGSVVPTDDGLRWLATDSGERIDIPDNLQALLTARMDRLDEETRRILQLAALIGRSFYYRILEQVVRGELGQAAAELDQELAALLRADLIREAARLPELEYMFRHSLTQEAAYRTILRKERRAYHQRVGEAIEALYPERLAENAPALAHHFHVSGDKPRAFRYALMAGDQAFRLYANAEAVAQYDQAIEAAAEADAEAADLIGLYTRRGRALELSMDINGARDNYLALADLAEARKEPLLRMAALNLMATIHSVLTPLFNPAKGLEMADEALALARELGHRPGEAKALWNRMLANALSGLDLEAATRDGEEALAIARAENLREQMAFILHDLRFSYRWQGRLDETLAISAEARELFREVNNLPLLATSYQEESNLTMAAGDLDKTMELLEEAYRISKAVGNAWNMHFSLAAMAVAAAHRGDAGRALAWLQEDEIIVREGGLSPSMLALSHIAHAFVQHTLGNPEEGVEAAERGEEAAAATPGPVGWTIRQIVALLYCELGRPDKAEPLLALERPAVPDPGGFAMAGYSDLAKVSYAAQTETPAEVLPKVSDLQAKLQEMGVNLYIPRLFGLQGELLLKLERRAEARRALEAGLAVARRQDQQPARQALLAALLPLVDDPAQRQSLQAEAREVVSYIAGRAGSEERRQEYLATAQVRQLLAVATEI